MAFKFKQVPHFLSFTYWEQTLDFFFVGEKNCRYFRGQLIKKKILISNTLKNVKVLQF